MSSDKIKIYHPMPGTELHVFWCAGCRETHTFDIGDDKWEFNGDMDFPSYKPSLKYPNCHLVLFGGMIHYCKDCDHELSGLSVPLEPF